MSEHDHRCLDWRLRLGRRGAGRKHIEPELPAHRAIRLDALRPLNVRRVLNRQQPLEKRIRRAIAIIGRREADVDVLGAELEEVTE